MEDVEVILFRDPVQHVVHCDECPGTSHASTAVDRDRLAVGVWVDLPHLLDEVDEGHGIDGDPVVGPGLEVKLRHLQGWNVWFSTLEERGQKWSSENFLILYDHFLIMYDHFLIMYDHKEVWTCNCIMKINHSLFCFSVITLALLDTPRLRKIIFLTEDSQNLAESNYKIKITKIKRTRAYKAHYLAC